MARSDDLSNEDLELVANHGRGPLERAVAIVKLAERNGRIDELHELVDQDGGEHRETDKPEQE